MTTYDRCPSLLQESLLLSTYEYIFASPHDRKFGNLCPERSAGCSDRTVFRRKASATRTMRASSPEGRRSFNEFTSDGKATLYLKPMDHVRLEMTSKGYDMAPQGLPPARTVPFTHGKHGEYAAAFRENREDQESPERRETRQRSREIEERAEN